MRSVLIVSGGGFQGAGLLESLQRIPSVRPLVADVHADNVTRYLCPDYVAVPPLADVGAFSTALFGLVEREGVRTIFPSTALELPVLASLRERLCDAGACTAVSSASLVGTLLDKEKTALFLRDAGLPAQAPINPALHDFANGLFGKPRRGWGSKGTVAARSAGEVGRHEMAAAPDSLVWFPLVETFEEFSADFCITATGLLSPIVLRKRLRTSGGFAVISESVDDTILSEITLNLARSLILHGGRGIFNIQLIRPSGGDAFVSDINPRFGTSAAHGLAEGINLPQFYINGSPWIEHGRRQVKTIRCLKTMAVPIIRAKPKGIVFDLDDTLVDHKLWMVTKVLGAYQAAARDWSDPCEFKLHALQLVDEGERGHLIDRLADHFSWSVEQRQIFLVAYRTTHVDPTPLFPDVAPVLDALKRGGYALTLLTDNPPATQRAKIEHAQGFEVFSSIVFARETGREKPCASAYAAAASSLSLDPADLWMIGDNYFRDGLGATSSGYAGAVIVNRSGTFIHPHGGLAGMASGDASGARIHQVSSLSLIREIFLST